jgi:hypothetical protein
MGVETAGSPRVVIVPLAPTEATVLVAPRVVTSAVVTRVDLAVPADIPAGTAAVVTLVVGAMAAVAVAAKFSTADMA